LKSEMAIPSCHVAFHFTVISRSPWCVLGSLDPGVGVQRIWLAWSRRRRLSLSFSAFLRHGEAPRRIWCVVRCHCCYEMFFILSKISLLRPILIVSLPRRVFLRDDGPSVGLNSWPALLCCYQLQHSFHKKGSFD